MLQNKTLLTNKCMRESINEFVDCLDRKTTNVHAEIFNVSPVLSLQ
jgi:hypothetical protein